MGVSDERSNFDPGAVRAKYQAEREKRLVEGRAAIRDLAHDEAFAKYREDPFTPVTPREPVDDDVDVVIVGGGHRGCRRRRPAAQARHRAHPHRSTRPAASAAPGTGTATRA